MEYENLDGITETEEEETLDAVSDLERVEQEIVEEAEDSVEADDDAGDVQAAAEAAETAFQFKEAQEAIDEIEHEVGA